MTIELGGELLSPNLKLLYEDVSSMPPGAALELILGSEEELRGTAGGQHEWFSRSGPSTIRVLPTSPDYVIAHEMLHVSTPLGK